MTICEIAPQYDRGKFAASSPPAPPPKYKVLQRCDYLGQRFVHLIHDWLNVGGGFLLEQCLGIVYCKVLLLGDGLDRLREQSGLRNPKC